MKNAEGDPIPTQLELFIVFGQPDVMWTQTGVWEQSIRDLFDDMRNQGIDTTAVSRHTAAPAVVQSCFTGFSGKYLNLYGQNRLSFTQMGTGEKVWNLDLYYSGNYGLSPNILQSYGITNCVSQTGLIQIMWGALGLDMSVAQSTERNKVWGYTTTAELVGRAETNNPFYYAASWKVRPTPDSQPICDEMSLSRSYFGDHTFLQDGSSQNIVDACVGPQLGTMDLATYLSTVQDSQGPYNQGAYTDSRMATTTDVDDLGLLVDTLGSTASVAATSEISEKQQALAAVRDTFNGKLIDTDWKAVLTNAAASNSLDYRTNLTLPGIDACTHEFTLTTGAGESSLGGSVCLESRGIEAAFQRFNALRQTRFREFQDLLTPVAGHGPACLALHFGEATSLLWQYYNAVVFLLGPTQIALGVLTSLRTTLDAAIVDTSELVAADLSGIALSAPQCQVGQTVHIAADQGLEKVALRLDHTHLRMIGRDDKIIRFLALARGSTRIKVGWCDPKRLVSRYREFALRIE